MGWSYDYTGQSASYHLEISRSKFHPTWLDMIVKPYKVQVHARRSSSQNDFIYLSAIATLLEPRHTLEQGLRASQQFIVADSGHGPDWDYIQAHLQHHDSRPTLSSALVTTIQIVALGGALATAGITYRAISRATNASSSRRLLAAGGATVSGFVVHTVLLALLVRVLARLPQGPSGDGQAL